MNIRVFPFLLFEYWRVVPFLSMNIRVLEGKVDWIRNISRIAEKRVIDELSLL